MSPETIDELVARFREDVDDTVSGDGSDALWRPSLVLGYANEAIDATAKATDTLVGVVSLPAKAGMNTVRFNRGVLHVFGATLASNGRALSPRNFNELGEAAGDDYGVPVPGSAALTSAVTGTPAFYVLDVVPRAMVLVPTPAQDDTVNVHCSMTIKSPLDYGDDLPFTDFEDVQLVLLYMKYLAYSKHDVETYDIQRANNYYDLFMARARDRKYALLNYRRRPGVVRMEW